LTGKGERILKQIPYSFTIEIKDYFIYYGVCKVEGLKLIEVSGTTVEDVIDNMQAAIVDYLSCFMGQGRKEEIPPADPNAKITIIDNRS
jgi:hypothetical protein